MDYQEKVAFLRQYRDSLRLETLLLEELAELRSRAEGLTRVLNGMPGAPSDGGALPRAVESIVEKQKELEHQAEQCNVIRSEVEKTIEQTENETDREILYRRYIIGQRFEQISVAMHLEYRWVRRRHKRAVETIPPKNKKQALANKELADSDQSSESGDFGSSTQNRKTFLP